MPSGPGALWDIIPRFIANESVAVAADKWSSAQKSYRDAQPENRFQLVFLFWVFFLL